MSPKLFLLNFLQRVLKRYFHGSQPQNPVMKVFRINPDIRILRLTRWLVGGCHSTMYFRSPDKIAKLNIVSFLFLNMGSQKTSPFEHQKHMLHQEKI